MVIPLTLFPGNEENIESVHNMHGAKCTQEVVININDVEAVNDIFKQLTVANKLHFMGTIRQLVVCT